MSDTDEVRRLQTENANLRLQLRREQLITRSVLTAVADFGAAVAMDRASGFGPAAPDVVMGLVQAVAGHRDEHRCRQVEIETVGT